jgi:hypothetical protein
MAYYRTLKSGDKQLIYTAADKRKQTDRRANTPSWPDQRAPRGREGIAAALGVAYYNDALELANEIRYLDHLISTWRDKLRLVRDPSLSSANYRRYIRSMIDALQARRRVADLALTIRTNSRIYVPDRRYHLSGPHDWIRQTRHDVLRLFS